MACVHRVETAGKNCYSHFAVWVWEGESCPLREHPQMLINQLLNQLSMKRLPMNQLFMNWSMRRRTSVTASGSESLTTQASNCGANVIS